MSQQPELRPPQRRSMPDSGSAHGPNHRPAPLDHLLIAANQAHRLRPIPAQMWPAILSNECRPPEPPPRRRTLARLGLKPPNPKGGVRSREAQLMAAATRLRPQPERFPKPSFPSLGLRLDQSPQQALPQRGPIAHFDRRSAGAKANFPPRRPGPLPVARNRFGHRQLPQHTLGMPSPTLPLLPSASFRLPPASLPRPYGESAGSGPAATPPAKGPRVAAGGAPMRPPGPVRRQPR